MLNVSSKENAIKTLWLLKKNTMGMQKDKYFFMSELNSIQLSYEWACLDYDCRVCVKYLFIINSQLVMLPSAGFVFHQLESHCFSICLLIIFSESVAVYRTHIQNLFYTTDTEALH